MTDVRAVHKLCVVAGVVLLRLELSQAITCHCLNNAPCNPSDGSCPNGCGPTYYGPGCQIGNLAFHKPAFQSSTFQTYTADQAVNGNVPPTGDVTEHNCSHTAESRSVPLWWYVRLSENEDFVIKSIDITRRQGITAKFLRFYYLLYTTDMFGDPDPNTWSQCAYQETTPSAVTTTFTCTQTTAIARRVAVYIGSHPEDVQMLILCEVQVEGYSYKETSNFQDINFSVTPGCNNLTVELVNPPVVRPSFIYVSVRTADDDVTRVERIRYPQNGTRSVTISAVAQHTYTVWLAPETCCIGLICLSSVTETNVDPSNCVIGPSSKILSTATPQREQYALTMVKNVVNITVKNPSQCSSNGSNFECTALQYGQVALGCSNSSFCNLDPRNSYSCTLNVSYSDGFRDTVTTFFNIGTANFSKVDVLVQTTCDSIYAEIGAINQSWDIQPRSIMFSIQSTNDGKTWNKQLPYVKSGNHAVTLTAASNTNYQISVSPVSCWNDKNCSSDSEAACFDPSQCMVGVSTIPKFTTTPQRQYSLDSRGCCISAKDQSLAKCEEPVLLNITCTGNVNATYKSSGGIGSTLCGLSKGKFYTCNLETVFQSGKVEKTVLLLRDDSISDCATESGKTAEYSPAIVAPSTLGTFLGVVIIVIVAYRSRRIYYERRGTTQQVNAIFVGNEYGGEEPKAQYSADTSSDKRNPKQVNMDRGSSNQRYTSRNTNPTYVPDYEELQCDD